MCRLACFPAGFSREKAIEILQNFEGCNSHGVGFAYVKDSRFKISKAPASLSDWLRSEKDKATFLNHMPHNGWTIAHLRWATHGDHSAKNTHPFPVNDWCFMHNGVFSESRHFRHIITKFKNPDKLESDGKLVPSPPRKLDGETDSEVAAHLLDIYGPNEFTEQIDTAGVFVGLHRSGKLYVMKTSGELCGFKRSGETEILASSLTGIERYNKDKFDYKNGVWEFSPEGKYIFGAEKKNKWASSYQGSSSNGFHSYGRPTSCEPKTNMTVGQPVSPSTTPLSKEERDELAANSCYGIQVRD